jgi:hypothetical protein
MATEPVPGIMVGNQDNGSLGRPVSFGLQLRGELGDFRARQDDLGYISKTYLLQNVLQFTQQRCLILRIDMLSL